MTPQVAMTSDQDDLPRKWIGSSREREILPTDLLETYIEARQAAEEDVRAAPYSPARWLDLCIVYQDLYFPELAAMCAHKAILLIHIICGHKEGRDVLAINPGLQLRRLALRGLAKSTGIHRRQCASNMAYQHILKQIYNDPSFDELLQQAYIALMSSLMSCHAFKDTMDVSNKAHELWPACEDINEIRADATEAFTGCVEERKKTPGHDTNDEGYRLTLGLLFRAKYPWLEEQLTQRSPALLKKLNREVQTISNFCAIKSLFPMSHPNDVGPLGVFASSDIPANTILFIDASSTALSCLPVTGTSHKATTRQCENCHASLHPIALGGKSVTSAKCCSTSYCSTSCRDIASPYHILNCGKSLAPLHDYATQTRVRCQNWDPLVIHRFLSVIRAHELTHYPEHIDDDPTKAVLNSHPLLSPSVVHLTQSSPPSTLSTEAGSLYAWSYPSHVLIPLFSLLTLGINPFTSFAYSGAGETINTLYARLDNNAAVTHSLCVAPHPPTSDSLSFNTTLHSWPQILPWEMSGIHAHFILFNHSCRANCAWMVACADMASSDTANVDKEAMPLQPTVMLDGKGKKVVLPVGSNHMVIKTKEAVKKGEELTIAYVPQELCGVEGALEKWVGEGGCFCVVCRGKLKEVKAVNV